MGRYKNQFTVVYCDTGWIFYSDSNLNIFTSQARGKYIGVGVCGQAPTSVIVNYSKLILVPSHKPLDPMIDLYAGQKIDLKTRVDMWVRMDVIQVE